LRTGALIIGSHHLRILTIPSSDAGFKHHIENALKASGDATPEAFETRLRRVFPRAVVRQREISGEAPAWYVYRDGGWRASMTGSWWEQPGLPRVGVSRDGWLSEANSTALGLLGVGRDDIGQRHFSEFVAPGTLDDSIELFRIVAAGNDLTATVVLRPAGGDVVAIDLHAWREGDSIVGVFRLADDVEMPEPAAPLPAHPFVTHPASDVAFRGYVELALARTPELTPEILALRLRRLYPHARVQPGDEHWVVTRDAGDGEVPGAAWWNDGSLPRVRYDAQALILEANQAAEDLIGSAMIGHYWQEFVTPGSTEQVTAMLEILAEVGRAESRFRMPGADGSLVEFDSYTEVEGETFTTVMRPRAV
jgi:PAS domain-containing protein